MANAIPAEVVGVIMSFNAGSAKDLLACAQVNSTWNYAFENDEVLWTVFATRVFFSGLKAVNFVGGFSPVYTKGRFTKLLHAAREELFPIPPYELTPIEGDCPRGTEERRCCPLFLELCEFDESKETKEAQQKRDKRLPRMCCPHCQTQIELLRKPKKRSRYERVFGVIDEEEAEFDAVQPSKLPWAALKPQGFLPKRNKETYAVIVVGPRQRRRSAMQFICALKTHWLQERTPSSCTVNPLLYYYGSCVHQYEIVAATPDGVDKAKRKVNDTHPFILTLEENPDAVALPHQPHEWVREPRWCGHIVSSTTTGKDLCRESNCGSRFVPALEFADMVAEHLESWCGSESECTDDTDTTDSE